MTLVANLGPISVCPTFPLHSSPGEEVVVQEDHPESGAQGDGGGKVHQYVVPSGWGCFTVVPGRWGVLQ